MRYQRQRRRTIQVPHVPRRNVTASDDTWRIEMNCAFPGPTATRCYSCLDRFVSEVVVIQLFKCKCLIFRPIVLYCAEACKLSNANYIKSDDSV